MVDVIEYLLEEQEQKKRRKFKIIKDLLSFIGEKNGFKITDREIVNITNIIADFNIKKEHIVYKEFIDNLINFFLKVIYYYDEGKFERFNFILENEKGINNSLKKCLKENKGSIFNICKYYSESRINEKKEIIFSNSYIDVIKLYRFKSETWEIPKENNNSLEIRIPLKGNLYYKNGILLKEREYLLSSPKAKLDKYKILTDNIELLVIRLKKEFLGKLKVKELENLKHQLLTIDEKSMENILNNTMFRDNYIFLMDVIIILLEVNDLVKTDILSISLIIENEDIIREAIEIIDNNITLSEDDIRIKLIERFKTNKQIEEIIYNGTKLTLKKFILKEKTKYIIEDYMNSFRVEFEELLKKYKYSNMKNLRYNIKNFYNLSIKDIKKVK